MAKDRVKTIAEELWKFDGGEYYIDYYLEEGPFNNAEEFAKDIFRTEIRSSGFDPVQDEYDLTDFETQLVYELIYKRVKENLPTLEEATQLALRKKLN